MKDDAENTEKRDQERLSPEDAAAVDAILDGAPDEGVSRERRERIEAWLKILSAAPAPEPRGDLVERTMAAVQADRMRLEPARPAAAAAPMRGNWPRRLAEFGAMGVAASIFVAVIIVGLGQSAQSRARTACAENLQKWSTAFRTYSADYGRQLPSLETPADRNWLSSASPTHSNAANLLPLVNGSLVAREALYCPGNAPKSDETPVTRPTLMDIGYSYVYLYGPTRPTWNEDHASIILADRNPIFVPGAMGVVADKNSANHHGHGNYVLRADGAVTWETSPNIGPGRDNIWTCSIGGQHYTSWSNGAR
jgi:hypothetical protein